MSYQLIKRRTFYALETLKDSCLLCLKEFFPLFLAWGASQAGPVLLLLIGVVAGGLFDWSAGFRHGGWGTLAGLLIPGLLLGWLWGGWIFVSLKVARGIPVKFGDIFRPLNQALSCLVVLSITSVLIGLGSFLVVPGALLFLKWQLAPFYVIDRNYGPIRALKESWNDTKTLFIPLALLDLCFVGIQAASAATIFGPVMCFMAQGVATAIVYSKWLIDENNPEYPQIEDYPDASAALPKKKQADRIEGGKP